MQLLSFSFLLDCKDNEVRLFCQFCSLLDPSNLQWYLAKHPHVWNKWMAVSMECQLRSHCCIDTWGNHCRHSRGSHFVRHILWRLTGEDSVEKRWLWLDTAICGVWIIMLMQWSNENIGGRDLSQEMEKHNRFERCADINKQCGNGLEI